MACTHGDGVRTSKLEHPCSTQALDRARPHPRRRPTRNTRVDSLDCDPPCTTAVRTPVELGRTGWDTAVRHRPGHPLSTIPFFVADAWQGLLKGHGLVSVQAEALRLELQLVDSLTGLLKVRHLVLDVPLADVASASMRTRAWGLYNVLSLQGARMDVFAGFPGARGGRCRMRIARRDRDACAAFVRQFERTGPARTGPEAA